LRAAGQLALVGILFMTVSNLLLIWAETKVATGFASLVIATIPIFVALTETVLPGGETLNVRGWFGTLLGAIGMLALLWPTLHRTGNTGANQRSLFGFVLLLGAALAFAAGSVLLRRFRFNVDIFVATAWQIAAAGVVNLLLSAVGGCFRTAHWTVSGVLATAYLAVFGSVVGFSAYTYLLKHVPVTKVSTYAFVNPIVAILIGAALFHERLAPAELAGTVLILFAVATVILSRTKTTPIPADPILELPFDE
jgi:drug/metabolite transporter (DMT)-like permease